MHHRWLRATVLAACSPLVLAGPVLACSPPAAPGGEGGIGAEKTGHRGDALLRTEPGQEPGAVAVLSTTRWESPYRGGPAEGAYASACQPGWIAAGIHGRAGHQIDRIGVVCRHLDADGKLRSEDLRETAGGEGGSSFISMCPEGHGIAGFTGRASSHIDSLQIVCDTPAGTVLSVGDTVGGFGGTPFSDVAPDRYFLTRLVGRSDGEIQGMWAVYHRLSP